MPAPYRMRLYRVAGSFKHKADRLGRFIPDNFFMNHDVPLALEGDL